RFRQRVFRRPLLAAWGTGIVVTVAIAAAWFLQPAADTAPASPQLPARRYLAVLPFKDLSGRPDGPVFSRGLSDTVSMRLGRYAGVHVILPAATAGALPAGASMRRVAQQLGATLILSGSVQRQNEELRVSYSLVDPFRGISFAGNTVNGRIQDLWGLQDAVADAVARDLGIEQRQRPSRPAGLATAQEQEQYVRALGELDNMHDEKAVDAALTHLYQLLETAPDSSLVHAALGRAYHIKYGLTRERDWAERASRACKRAASLDPDSPETLITLGTVEVLLGNYEDSIAAFRKALAARPASREAAIGLAQSLSLTRSPETEPAFRRAIAVQPDWWYAHSAFGGHYWQRGRYDDALREFEEVIRLVPENSWGYTNAGAAHIARGNLRDAMSMFTKATALAEDPAAWLNVGYCRFFLGDFDGAADASRKAVGLRSGNPSFWLEFADACSWSPKCRGEAPAAFAEAAKLAREELSLNPKNARAYAVLAIALAKGGQEAEGTRAIGQAMDLDPENPEFLFASARIANLMERDDDALALLKKAMAGGSYHLEYARHPEFARLRSTESGRALLSTAVAKIN
ncbi:MAG TPA: tetratricopeptide repeat protein, partial [Thermoanaerobaculia bacterium]|nr:tetratricopeptide repeat protein [Thermoanaerobaculia bacterium]